MAIRALEASVDGMETLGEAWREVGALGRGGVLRGGGVFRGGGVLRGCLEGLAAWLAAASLAPAGCDGGCCLRFRDFDFC